MDVTLDAWLNFHRAGTIMQRTLAARTPPRPVPKASIARRVAAAERMMTRLALLIQLLPLLVLDRRAPSTAAALGSDADGGQGAPTNGGLPLAECPSGCGHKRCNASFVDASCWWNPQAEDGNATAAIAAALATRAPTISIPAMDRPWLVAPVFGLSYASATCTGSHPTVICLDRNSSNTTIRFEPGALVLAKSGSFHGLGDTLLRANNAHGITLIGHGAILRMRRADYGNSSKYAHSEFRMGLSFYGVRELTIEGLTVEETGGDGLYLQDTYNVTVRGATFMRNYRQGMSISSCTNCSFIDTVFSNTSGTWPKCGVDIEPSGCGKAQQPHPGVWHQGCHLTSIIFKNCTADYNHGCGFSVDPGGRDLTIAFEDCRLHNNQGASFMIDNMEPHVNISDLTSHVGVGWLNITRTVAVGGPGPGLMLQNKGVGGVPINVVDTVLDDTAQTGPKSLPPHINGPVLLTTKMELGHQYYALGGVNFNNLTVKYGNGTTRFTATMPWLTVAAGQAVAVNGKPITNPKAASGIEQVRQLSGDVTVLGGAASTTACSEAYAAFVPTGGSSWQKKPLKHSQINLDVRCKIDDSGTARARTDCCADKF